MRKAFATTSMLNEPATQIKLLRLFQKSFVIDIGFAEYAAFLQTNVSALLLLVVAYLLHKNQKKANG